MAVRVLLSAAQEGTVKFIPQVEPWIDDAEVDHMTEYLLSGAWLTEFRKTEEFAQMIAAYTGLKYCCVVNNGTVSLILALLALGLDPGDEVIVPDFTMIASANAVRLVGATPVLVDVSPDTLCLDHERIAAALSPRTRVVMLVSLNGRFPSDIVEIQALCREYEIFLLEDGAQSLGSRYRGRQIGTFGVMGTFSFSPHKIVTTGQGGAIVTDDPDLYQRLQRLKNFGRDVGGEDIHPHMGWNFKFTDVQAVIGIEQMRKLEWRVRRKREIFRRYRDNLAAVDGVFFLPTNLEHTAPWFMDILVQDRAGLMSALEEANVGTRPFYPPVHNQPIYSGSDAAFPVTCSIAARGLWLPSSTKLTDAQVDYVCEQIMRCRSG